MPRQKALSKRLWLPLLAILFLLAAVAGFLLSPLGVCTKMGCFDSLELGFSPPFTQEYTVRVTTTAGETRQVTCSPGPGEAFRSDTDPTTAICRPSSVTFLAFTPQEVTIAISWQNGGLSTTGSPRYQPFKPNGCLCPPTCRVGSLQVEVSTSPDRANP